jgi:anti-sigma regulatory factor (Ser/Thr protein kinase)
VPRLSTSYDGRPSSVPAARHAVEEALRAWGLEGLAWTAALLVTELTANALLHAGTGFTVSLLTVAGGRVRIEVADGSRRTPRTRRFGEDATTGRGMHLVSDLSADWGVQTSMTGKTVWVELAPPDDAPEDEAEQEDDVDALLQAYGDLDLPEQAPGATADTRCRAA